MPYSSSCSQCHTFGEIFISAHYRAKPSSSLAQTESLFCCEVVYSLLFISFIIMRTRETRVSHTWWSNIATYCTEQWQGVLFLFAGLFRAGSLAVLYPHAWRDASQALLPTVSIVVFAAFHVLECACRIPLMQQAPDITTRLQPYVFLVGYLVLFAFYVTPYVRKWSGGVVHKDRSRW